MKIVADTNIPLVQSAFGELAEIRVLDKVSITHEKLLNVDALLVRSETRVNRELLHGTDVKYVGSATSGIDHIDVDYLRENGIGFQDGLGSNSNSVAEYIMSALLKLGVENEFDLQGKTIGVVGVGNVGRKVVRMAEGLGMTVLQNDPPRQRLEGGSQFLSLDQLMEADIITVHVPLDKHGIDATYHLFDHERFDRLRPDCVLINASRGAVVETSAIKSAIQAKRMRFVILDVWENEPAIDPELLALVDIATSHIAGYSLDGKVNGTRMILDGFCEHFGLQRHWDPSPEMAPPEHALISGVQELDSFAETVYAVVRQCYDIERDNQALKSYLDNPVAPIGEYFIRLRRQYPVRREFFNTRLAISDIKDETRKALQALGFHTDV
jgi:erythronate-4-phosphate dehydrogenase